jgi:predicted DNA binding protein
MWVAKFKLKDENDIYSHLCEKLKIDFFAVPYTQFTKNKKINLLGGGVISGSEENKKQFVNNLKKDSRVKSAEQYHDFVLIHAQHPISREAKEEIKIFYNPQYIKTKPIHMSVDGWEYWEVACLDRNELNKIIKTAIKYYNGKLFSVKKEKLKSVSSLELTPVLTLKQFEAIKLAYKEGYYNYPRKLTIPELAKTIKKSYSTFQENLRKAENKLIDYFLKYR